MSACRRATFAALFVVALAAAGRSPVAGEDLDRFVEARRQALHLPGLALAVVRQGTVVEIAGYGFADLENGVPVEPATVFEIGSCTKAFTGLAITLLVEEGKVALDDPVSRWFPDSPPEWGGVTVRHLLHHTSGIRDHVAVPEIFGRFRTNLLGETFPSRPEILRAFWELPLEFAPGSSWAYDNTGYHLLGSIVEAASGEPYWQFLSQRVLGPTGMGASGPSDPAPLVPHRASGYGWTGERFVNRPALPPFVGFAAGSLLSTVQDLALWDAALRSDVLLPEAARDSLWQPAKLADGSHLPADYGRGWFVDVENGRRFALHSGGTPGFSCSIRRDLDTGLTIVLLANAGDRMLDALAVDVAGLVDPAYRRPEPAVDPDVATSERIGRVIRGLLAGRVEPDALGEAMSTHLRTTSGRGMWAWIASHGPLEGLVFSRRDDDGAERVLRYRVVLGGAPYWLSVRIDDAGRIVQILPW